MADPILFLVGAGPLTGRAIAQKFSEQRYKRVALFARREDQLQTEAAALGADIQVKTFAVDVTDYQALRSAFDQAEAQLGKPECICYNAARVQFSDISSLDVEEIDYELKINVSGLYVVAQRYMPHLVELAQSSEARPSLVVCSSLLTDYPHPAYFNLSLAKAAQRNLVKTLNATYADKGVAIGLINMGGIVTQEHEVRNPRNIAQESWKWLERQNSDPSLEVKVGWEM